MRRLSITGFGLMILLILGISLSEGGKMKSNKLLEIKLSSDKMSMLKAVLINHSGVSQNILHDPLLQPSRLDLIGSDGRRIDPFDTRSIKKYDATIYCSHFKRLAPGSEIELGSIQFKRTGQGYAATWGPYEFEKLPSGAYTARIVWESTADSCMDEETQQLRRLPSVWLGQLESNDVSLQLR